ncbi:MAG: helicase [Leptospiraceae bacterium]|nr:helicase [Leptospiraceae bacterium]MDW7976280.1 helicase [Leptospiraceae bacterium]
MKPEENPLLVELLKIDGNTLKRLLTIWNIKKIPKDKKNQIKTLMAVMSDEFYVKGILEKLSSIQIQIYLEILSVKDKVLTLGEIARKFSLPPNNAEVELGVLKRYFLVYQRKNRERLTNTLDRYYAYPQSVNAIQFTERKPQEIFQQRIIDVIERIRKEGKLNTLNPIWQTHEKLTDTQIQENIAKLIGELNEVEEELVLAAFKQGGILEINTAREIIDKHKLHWEEVIIKLHKQLLLIDEFFVEERFVRILVMPADVFDYIVKNPIVPKAPKGVKKSLEKITDNQLDFFINIKRTIAYILKRGITLSKSGKLKQTDLRDTENILLPVDIQLFKEKSQIYQIELTLSIMRVLDILRIKKDDVVLRNDWEDLLKKDPLEILKKTLKAIEEIEEKLVRYEEVFEPVHVPFYKKKVFQSVVKTLLKQERNIYYVIMALLIRENIILKNDFTMKDFSERLSAYEKELVSALFYLQLFGYLQVEYPDRWISFSKLGLHMVKKEPLKKENQKGGVYVNPDLSIIAFPEKLSLSGLYYLKTFCELKSFENIYTFQFTRDSFFLALLMKEDPNDFINFLKEVSPTDLPQNLLFSINEWKNNLPLVTITDECVVVKTKESQHMELLIGQISNKDYIIEQLTPNTIIIEQEAIPELIELAEKMNLLVKLYR